MGDVSEETLLNYIYSLGGKVKNADILKKYKPFISHDDLQLRAKYREEFKANIDRIALVKSENTLIQSELTTGTFPLEERRVKCLAQGHSCGIRQGEKYLVLKKRYRQQLQDRERSSQTMPACTTLVSEGARTSAILHSQEDQRRLGTDGEGSSSDMEAERERGGSGPAVWEGPAIIITESQNQLADQEAKTNSFVLREISTLSSETPEPTDGEDEVERESVSKSDQESDHEEECGGNEVCNSVALDPVEKDWLYSAACAQVSHLTQLLEQEPALANKKDFTSFTALHWAAKHGKEDMTRVMANAGANINSRAGYTPLHIAALHGHRHIMDLLVGTYGAKENLRDYSGRFAHYYISQRSSAEEDTELHVEGHAVQANERKNRKLASLFHSKKKWGSAEELAPVPEERSTPHQLMIPAFRPRKFSR